ncbi:MAG: hypothetical protein ACLGQX_02200 [Acidobacteriota bacterium]
MIEYFNDVPVGGHQAVIVDQEPSSEYLEEDGLLSGRQVDQL